MARWAVTRRRVRERSIWTCVDGRGNLQVGTRQMIYSARLSSDHGITMMAPCPGQRQRHTSDGSREWNAVQAMESSLMVVGTMRRPGTRVAVHSPRTNLARALARRLGGPNAAARDDGSGSCKIHSCVLSLSVALGASPSPPRRYLQSCENENLDEEVKDRGTYRTSH